MKDRMRVRTEFVTCRSDAFWTDGKDFCSPPECSRYLQYSSDDVYNAIFSLDLNIDDINAVNISHRIRFLSLDSPSDPRFIMNKTSNTTELLETAAFLELCSKYGPCKNGHFLQQDNLLYAKGGYPTLTIEKNGKSNTFFMALRHDPRPFVTRAKDDPCPIGIGRKYRVCTSSFGTQSIQKLWELDLPLIGNRLVLFIRVSFTYKDDCKIKVIDIIPRKTLVDFTGPCGRYADLKRGNYPFAKIEYLPIHCWLHL